MSRIGKLKIDLPDKVKVQEENNVVHVEGPNGKLNHEIPQGIKMEVTDKDILFVRKNDSKQDRMNHGMIRAKVANMVEGVSKGFRKNLEIRGVGYRCEIKGKYIVFALGYSHPVYFEVPQAIKANIENRGLKIELFSHDKVILGRIAAEIRSLRPPEPYKGKGIRYEGEYVKEKEGKAKA
ncbi:MAG: 50S ribosomal protein L6 [Deltaproteobacteria bacterium]|jgi:large subunit ribosomal protein L6|nr:50S ribosomal protein L6 [Deltaproteobacteria bacterium]